MEGRDGTTALVKCINFIRQEKLLRIWRKWAIKHIHSRNTYWDTNLPQYPGYMGETQPKANKEKFLFLYNLDHENWWIALEKEHSYVSKIKNIWSRKSWTPGALGVRRLSYVALINKPHQNLSCSTFSCKGRQLTFRR